MKKKTFWEKCKAAIIVSVLKLVALGTSGLFIIDP